MSTDMEKDYFAEQPYGRLALKKMAPTPWNFRLYRAAWEGDKPGDRQVMKVTGAEFRRAKSGPNKGKLSIMIPDTSKTAYLTAEEVRAAE